MKTLGAVSFALALVAMTAPETKVDLKGVHLCCGGCEKASVKLVEDASSKATADRKAGTFSITAADAAAAQKALDAIAAGGFYGSTGNKDLAIKDDSGAKKGKVTSLSLKGAHNCCGACCKAIKAAVKKCAGVESDDAKPKEGAFTVKGNFDAAELVKTLNDAGIHVVVDAK